MASEIRTVSDDLDVCMCGDYRRDHVDGVGRCLMPNNLTHGFRPCIQFRLLRQATEAEKAQAARMARDLAKEVGDG